MCTSASVKVLCVDDNRLVADAIFTKLRMAGGFEWLGHLKTADDLLETASRQSPDIILLDLDMPGADPLTAAHNLLEAGSSARVVVLSGHASPELFDRAIRAGAWGYISKSDGEDAMVDGLRNVAGGGFALSPEIDAICDRHSQGRGAQHDPAIPSLSLRSREAIEDSEARRVGRWAAESASEVTDADEAAQ